MKRNAIADMKEEVAAWRRSLHENPGLAYQEFFASELVESKLKEWGIPYQKGLGKTGIVATITGNKNTCGKTIGLRADMDALPIDEKSGQPWASKVPGVMHACGHDGHTATLLGTAKYLNETRNFDGRVHLIFQPAEEGAHGAEAMMADGLFQGDLKCDAIFALHNWPSIPLGTVGTRPGAIMASVDSFSGVVHGKGGHAAYPHKCVDPVVIFAELTLAFQTIISRAATPQEPCVLTLTNVSAGKGAFNIIPDTLTFSGTVRTYNDDIRLMIEQKMKTLGAAICAAHGGSFDLDYKHNTAPTVNDAEAAAIAMDAAARIVSDANVHRDIMPSMGGEDFGAMLKICKGAYMYIGQATSDQNSPHNQALHHPGFDFNDDIIPIAMDYFVELVESQLPVKE